MPARSRLPGANGVSCAGPSVGTVAGVPIPLALSAFFVFGVALVLPGTSQIAVARAFDLGLAQSGLLASALSIGLGVGVLASGPAVDRLPRRPLFVGAALLAAAGVGMAPLLPAFYGVLLAVAVLGVGAGVTETVLNTVIPEQAPERAAQRLSLAHAGATAGAVVGAQLLGVGIAWRGWAPAWIALAIAYAAVATLAFGRTLAPTVRAAAPAAASSDALGDRGVVLRALPLMFAAFAYVGLETALTLFLPALVEQSQLAAARGPASISALWLGLAIGRVAFAAFALPGGGRTLVGMAVLGGGVLALGPLASPVAPEIWSFATGLVLGPAFPVLVAMAGERFPRSRGTAVAVVVAAGAAGGTLLPWSTGLLAEEIGVAGALGALAIWGFSLGVGARR